MSANSQSSSWEPYKKELKGNWKMQSSSNVSATAKEISTPEFSSAGWYKAQVPGTVLGALVSDGVFKDIFFNRNLSEIPDSLFNVPWWFRTTFRLNKKSANQVVRLRFNGINYKADVWINGRQIASSDSIAGGFRQFVLDVSNYVHDGENALAVEITRPYPGDLTLGFVDWNPEPPDRNMGMWRNVELLVSGPVSVDLPFVQSKVDTASLKHAELTISSVLNNHSDQTVVGTLKGAIGNEIHFSQKITLKPHESKLIVFDPEKYAQLKMNNPRLWWVHTWGKPNLYHLSLQFEEKKGESDFANVRFGIRQINDYFTADGHRGYKLNGRKILIKGGGWTDPMLMNVTPEYTKAEIDYAVHMNLNTIRMEGFWGNSQYIFNLCDEKGILIMAGLSCQWEWNAYLGTPKMDKYNAFFTPEQNDVAVGSFEDQVKWLRNHPSIFVWLYGSDKWPRPDLEKRYLATLKEYDTTRPSLSSAGGVVSAITGPSGVKMRGPYDYVPPVYWYIDSTHGGAYGFNTETGPGPQVPVIESLKKMIPADSLWPISTSWLFHSARGHFYNMTFYNRAIKERLGDPVNLADYSRKAQYLNYDGMRAMYEAFEANRFKTTGIIQWMYNASWPKLWWQLFDYYLQPTGAFYGAQKANEPLHIFYNYKNNSIGVLSNELKGVSGLTAEIQVLNFDLKPVVKKNIPVAEIPVQGTENIFKIPDDLQLSKTYFVDLKLFSKAHQLISSNFYVLSTQADILDEPKSTPFVTPETQFGDLTMLQTLPDVALQVSRSVKEEGGNTTATIRIKNPSRHLAFMIYLDLKKKKTDASVLPVFWNDNFITLLPGEERVINGYVHTKDLDGEQPEITISGWNIK
ncbi:MAG: hypothetical protein J0H55_00320 [Chitinophagaceae bacterium]|nr:hypothetical protein [Chitinophagaceae bacterium]